MLRFDLICLILTQNWAVGTELLFAPDYVSTVLFFCGWYGRPISFFIILSCLRGGLFRFVLRQRIDNFPRFDILQLRPRFFFDRLWIMLQRIDILFKFRILVL